MSQMPVLIRREFWEHRALWVTPAVVVGLLLLALLFGDVRPLFISRNGPFELEQLQPLLQYALSMPLYFVMLLVLFFYLLDALYAERKDRSILFWRSLPVSDAKTVVSKLLTALVAAPLFVYLLSTLTNLVFAGAWSTFGLPTAEWTMLTWLRIQLLMLVALFASMLWYAPVAAYLLVVSAWARRSAVLWAVLPPIAAMAMERMLLGSDYIADFLGYRLGTAWSGMDISMNELLQGYDVTHALAKPGLWLGVVAAAALTYLAIRIRGLRDAT